MTASPVRTVLALMLCALACGRAPAADDPKPAAPLATPAVSTAFSALFKPAQDAMKAGDGAAALACIRQLEALPAPSAYERYLVLRVRAPAEFTAGKLAEAARDYEALLADAFLPPEDRLQMLKAWSSVLVADDRYAQAATAIQRYLDAGGDDPALRQRLPQARYVAKDYAGAEALLKMRVDAAAAAGKPPAEDDLRLLASAAFHAGDDAVYLRALDGLAAAYPKKAYWHELLARARRVDADLPERLFVDSCRLEAAMLGDVADDERLAWAAGAARAGFPGEARRALEDGLARKSFTGATLAEATRLRDQAEHDAAEESAVRGEAERAAKAARDGNALADLGLQETLEGNATGGAALIEQALAKGGLAHPDEARLHLGYAQYWAGRLDEATESFRGVSGTGAAPALAHVWALFTQQRRQAAGAKE